MPTRKPPSQRDAEVKAKIRADTEVAAANRQERAKPVPKPKLPEPSTPPVVRQHIEGNREDAPLHGAIVAVPDYADTIALLVDRKTGPADITLQASMDRDAEEWGPCPFKRPPVASMRSVTAVPEDAPGRGTKSEVVEDLSHLPSPARYPQWVRVAVVPRTRRSHYSADVTISFRSTEL